MTMLAGVVKSSPKRFYGHSNHVIAWMIRQLYFSRRMKQAQLAAFFHVSQSTVSKILSNKVWSDPNESVSVWPHGNVGSLRLEARRDHGRPS